MQTNLATTIQELKIEYPDKHDAIDRIVEAVFLWKKLAGNVPKGAHVVRCSDFVLMALEDIAPPNDWWNLISRWLFERMIRYIIKKLLENLDA